MGDVVLHYQPGSTAGLSSLLETTEKLLESFPCRPPPVFTSWFPSATDGHLPIRPAKPAPIITCSAPTTTPQKPKDEVSETTAKRLLPAPQRGVTRPTRPEKHKDASPGSPLKRSWSVAAHAGVLLRSSQPLSRPFHHMVSNHRLHLRQRVRWVVGQHSWGASRDIEQVWQAVSRSVRRSRSPPFNANIQRERAEIWVFCDVVDSEQVGRLLKEELQLSGRISLSARRLGDIFSM